MTLNFQPCPPPPRSVSSTTNTFSVNTDGSLTGPNGKIYDIVNLTIEGKTYQQKDITKMKSEGDGAAKLLELAQKIADMLNHKPILSHCQSDPSKSKKIKIDYNGVSYNDPSCKHMLNDKIRTSFSKFSTYLETKIKQRLPLEPSPDPAEVERKRQEKLKAQKKIKHKPSDDSIDGSHGADLPGTP